MAVRVCIFIIMFFSLLVGVPYRKYRILLLDRLVHFFRLNHRDWRYALLISDVWFCLSLACYSTSGNSGNLAFLLFLLLSRKLILYIFKLYPGFAMLPQSNNGGY